LVREKRFVGLLVADIIIAIAAIATMPPQWLSLDPFKMLIV
jgi:hypothetical protein